LIDRPRAGDDREVAVLQFTLRKAGKLVALALVAAGALGSSQISAFMQHYQQNLAGRLAEARQDVIAISERASEAGLPIYAYLDEFRRAANPIFVREGIWLKSKIDRAAWLEAHLGALRNAGPVARPYTFVTQADPTIAAETWINFEPAVPLDRVSLIYSAIGALLGLLIYYPAAAAIAVPARMIGNRRTAKLARDRIGPRVRSE
jgi:hypothetical protein